MTRARLRPFAVELAAVGSVALYNVVSHRHIGRRARLATNVSAAVALVGSRARAGLGAVDLGLEPANLRRGIRTGIVAAAPIVAGVGVALAVPQTRRVLADEQITGTGRGEAAFETFVRIPLETALAEEIIFRGVLLGLGLHRRSQIGAIVELVDLVRSLARVPDARVPRPGRWRRSRGRPTTPRGRGDGGGRRRHDRCRGAPRGPSATVGQRRRTGDRARRPQHGGVSNRASFLNLATGLVMFGSIRAPQDVACGGISCAQIFQFSVKLCPLARGIQLSLCGCFSVA